MTPELSLADWEDLTKRLAVYAHYKTARLSWRGVRSKRDRVLPDGHSAESIAQEAILSVIEGRRACSATTKEELLRDLLSVVDSLVSNLVQLIENRLTRQAPAGPDGRPRDDWAGHTSRGARPDVGTGEREALELFRQLVLKAIGGDRLAVRVFECLEAEVTMPSEMAVVLEVTVADINNAQKRLRRAVSAVLGKTGKAAHERA